MKTRSIGKQEELGDMGSYGDLSEKKAGIKDLRNLI